LLKRLDEIREQGYSVVDGEYNQELLCISAPVLDHSHRPRASLTIAMLSHQAASTRTIEVLAGHVKDASRALSLALGYEGSKKAVE
jgi:IclR family acetate operon transcriptional repressor